MPYQYYPTYQPYQYQPPVPDHLAQLRQQYQPQQQQGQSIVWVSGEQEAMGYLVAPNSAVALWDSTQPVIYLKQADASGKPSIKIYDLVERTAARTPVNNANTLKVEYVTRDEFNALAAKFEALTVANTNTDNAKEETSNG